MASSNYLPLWQNLPLYHHFTPNHHLRHLFCPVPDLISVQLSQHPYGLCTSVRALTPSLLRSQYRESQPLSGPKCKGWNLLLSSLRPRRNTAGASTQKRQFAHQVRLLFLIPTTTSSKSTASFRTLSRPVQNSLMLNFNFTCNSPLVLAQSSIFPRSITLTARTT